MEIILLLVGLIISAIIGAGIAYFLAQQGTKNIQNEREELIRKYEQKLHDVATRHQQEVDEARKESVDQSRSTLRGKMAEQMAPLLPGFNFLPADSRFLGDPVDYVVFHGYSNLRDKNANPETIEVVILDIKQGMAQLSVSQRAIAKAVEEGRVRFDVVRVSDDGTVKSHTWRSKRGKKLEQSNEGVGDG